MKEHLEALAGIVAEIKSLRPYLMNKNINILVTFTYTNKQYYETNSAR